MPQKRLGRAGRAGERADVSMMGFRVNCRLEAAAKAEGRSAFTARVMMRYAI